MNVPQNVAGRYPASFLLLVLTVILQIGSAASVAADLPRTTTTPYSNEVADVALSPDSELGGCLIDPFGRVISEALVTVRQHRKVIWSGRTNVQGEFQVKGLDCGVYRIDCEQSSRVYRVWPKNAAPPGTAKSLVLVREVEKNRPSFLKRTVTTPIHMAGNSTMAFPRFLKRDLRSPISP